MIDSCLEVSCKSRSIYSQVHSWSFCWPLSSIHFCNVAVTMKFPKPMCPTLGEITSIIKISSASSVPGSRQSERALVVHILFSIVFCQNTVSVLVTNRDTFEGRGSKRTVWPCSPWHNPAFMGVRAPNWVVLWPLFQSGPWLHQIFPRPLPSLW